MSEPKRYRVRHRPDIFNESRTGAWIVEYIGGPPEGTTNAFADMRPYRTKEAAEAAMERLEQPIYTTVTAAIPTWAFKQSIVFVNPANPNDKMEFDSIEALNARLFEIKAEVERLRKAGDALVDEGETMAHEVSWVPYTWDNLVIDWNAAKDGKPTEERSPSFIEDLGNGVEKHDLLFRYPDENNKTTECQNATISPGGDFVDLVKEIDRLKAENERISKQVNNLILRLQKSYDEHAETMNKLKK